MDIWDPSRQSYVETEPKDVEVHQQPQDIKRIGDILAGIGAVQRFRAVKPETRDYLPLLREKNDVTYPLAAIPYGLGYLILAGMHIDNDGSSEFTILVKAVNHIIYYDLKRAG